MAKRFTDPDMFQEDYVKAVRRHSREAEFEQYGRTNARPSMRPERIKKSKKAYTRHSKNYFYDED